MRSQLEQLQIHQFRGLRELNLADLGRVNLLVGANNSGKTSILEAVAAFGRPLDLHTWLDAAARRENRSFGEPFFDAVEWLFPHAPVSREQQPYEGETRISGYGLFPVRSARASYKRTFRVTTEKVQVGEDEYEDIESQQSGAEVRFLVRIEEGDTEKEETGEFYLWENTPLALPGQRRGLALPVRTITPVSHRVEQFQLRQLSDAMLEGFKQRALTLVQKMDPDILDIFIASPKGTRPAVYLDHRHVGRAPLSAFGDGVRRTLLIALTLPAVSGGVLLIDEIEASIHVSALETVFSWIVRACVELDVQIFATTHSLEAVDAVLESAGRDAGAVVGYRLDRREGVVEAERFSHNLLHRLRADRGLDVRI